MTELDRQKLDVFHNGALRRISRIFWADKVTNKALYEGTHSEPMSATVKRKRLKWFGHISRMPQNRIPYVTMNWTPSGKRKKGRPTTTLRSTVKNELEEMGLT
jgi:hypothetical protein